MSLKIVVGAGGTGRVTAELLAGSGHQVRLVTRRGSGPTHPRIHRIALDATDTAALIDAIKLQQRYSTAPHRRITCGRSSFPRLRPRF